MARALEILRLSAGDGDVTQDRVAACILLGRVREATDLIRIGGESEWRGRTEFLFFLNRVCDLWAGSCSFLFPFLVRTMIIINNKAMVTVSRHSPTAPLDRDADSASLEQQEAWAFVRYGHIFHYHPGHSLLGGSRISHNELRTKMMNDCHYQYLMKGNNELRMKMMNDCHDQISSL